MALTDLTNTTWVLNDTLSSYPGGTYNIKTYNINITTETPLPYSGSSVDTEDTFVAIMIGYDSGSEINKVVFLASLPQSYDNFVQMASGNDTKSLPDTWNTYKDTSFTITGGTDATNSTLIAWLEQNAAAPPVPDVVVTYNDNDIVTMTDSSVKTLATSGTYCTDDIKITFTKQSGGGSTGYTYIAEDVNYGSVKLGNVPALTASGTNSVAQGSSSTASGNYSHAEGNGSLAGGEYSHAEGSATSAFGQASHAEGSDSIANAYTAHAEGLQTTVTGNASHVQGRYTSSTAVAAHAEGQSSIANGNFAHAEGDHTTASGAQSHAEGYYSLASTATAHAEGDNTTASGYASHAQGTGNIASSAQAFAGGYHSTASHSNSFVHGMNLKTSHSEQAVFGAFNADDSTALLLVGHGVSNADADRRNAFTVHTNGRVSAGADAVNDQNLVRFGQVNVFDEHNNVGGTACSNGSWATLCSTTLTPGLFLIDVHAECPSSSVGRRALIISTSSTGTTSNLLNKSCKAVVAPVNGDVTTVKIQTLLNITSNTQIWCRFWQNSGSSRSIQSAMRLVKLK